MAKKRAARRARLTETKEKQKIPQAQPLVAEQLQQHQLALLQPRQEQERVEQEGRHDIKGWCWLMVVCSDRSFLHRNAGKMTTIKAKLENLSKETAKHHTCPEDAARRNLKDIA